MKNNRRYLNAPARMSLALALFLFGTTVCASMRSLPAVECSAIPSASRNIAANDIELIKHWFIAKYDDLRFVYQVEMQISELRSAELERQRKSQLRSSRVLGLETEPRP